MPIVISLFLIDMTISANVSCNSLAIIDGLSIFQSVATDEKRLIIALVGLSPFSSLVSWKILWHWLVIWTFWFDTLLFWLRVFYLTLFSSHRNTLWNKFSDGNGIYLAVLVFCHTYLLFIVIQFTVHFVVGIFTDADEYVRYRRYAQQSVCTSRATSFRSYPFNGDVHWCP